MSTGEAGDRWQRRHHPRRSKNIIGNTTHYNPSNTNRDRYNAVTDHEVDGYNRYRMHAREETDTGLLPSSDSFPSPLMRRINVDDNDDDTGGRSRIIRRESGNGRQEQKLVELTTPTLVDEDDYYEDEEEEQEIVAMENARIRRNAAAPIGSHHQAFFVNEEDLRRTPGAQMYRSSFSLSAFDSESVRRTPGASIMHASAMSSTTTLSQSDPPPSATDASGLGFGLTLSTPIATVDSRPKQVGIPRSTWDPHSLSRGNSQFKEKTSGGNDDGVSSGGAFASPWSTMKHQQQQQQHLESGRGVYSPNTLRLTEDLDNLLLEDDDAASEESQKFNQFVFRSSDIASNSGDTHTQMQNTENWTTAYVVSAEHPSRVPRGVIGRGRKNRLDQARRSRGAFTGNTYSSMNYGSQQRSGGFAPYAQVPTPIRTGQPQLFGDFHCGGIGALSPSGAPDFTASLQGHGSIAASSFDHHTHLLATGLGTTAVNFGGAFSPPAKEQSAVAAPYEPSASSSLGDPKMHAGNRATSRNATLPPFPTASQPYGLESFDQAHAMVPTANIQSLVPQFGMAPLCAVFPSSHVPPQPSTNQSPTLNFSHSNNMGYAIPVAMHPPQLVSNVILHPSPSQFSSPAQPWPPTMGMQFNSMAHPHAVQAGWGMIAFPRPYVLQSALPTPTSAHDPSSGRTLSTPSPVWNPEGEISQGAPPNVSNQPVTSSPSTGRPPSRGKNPRKGSTKKWVNKVPSKEVDRNNSDVSRTTPTFGKKSQAVKTGKKKTSKDPCTPTQGERPSSALSEDVADSSVPGPAEDPGEAKRAELTESPQVRSAFKDFYRRFRTEEKNSAQSAEEFAIRTLKEGAIPESVHWRVYLEVADLVRRSNRFEEARKLYQKACHLQPYASQVWFEYSKLEEECGNMKTCTKILQTGLQYCEYSENLLSRAIKHEEKMGNLSRARELLSRLKHVGIEKVWRSVLEGALIESRAGNAKMARRVLKYLMHHVPWYGPLYLEAFKLEKDLGRSRDALAIVEKGLAAIPRYGPLWFGAFRLCEELDVEEEAFRLPRSMGMIDRAISNISKELLWKVHLEAAQMLERSSTEYMDNSSDASSVLDMCRKRFAMTFFLCPPSLRWKVWLAAGRMEVAAGNSDIARRLFLHAHRVVPDKGRAIALLECARLEEFVGDVQLANAILCKSRLLGASDWKVWLESVMQCIRSGDYLRAVTLSQQALLLHSGTGRLWASLIQLLHFSGGERAQFESLRLALNAVPKSGEVWCEGARIHLNPFSHTFDLQRASRHLFFATKFTPQYGDGFLESLRLLVIVQVLLPIASQIWEETKASFPEDGAQSWNENLVQFILKLLRELYRIRDVVDSDSLPGMPRKSLSDSYLGESVVKSILQRLYSERTPDFLDTSKLELRCANADPNYGPLWFYCRARPTDTARLVLSRAVGIILDDVKFYANIYVVAMIRRFVIVSQFDRIRDASINNGTSEWENLIDAKCLEAPSLRDILDFGSDSMKTGVEFLESSIPSSDFITGIVAQSRHRPIEEMSSYERRKTLFGADSIFS